MARIPDLPAMSASTTAVLSAAQLAGGGGRPRRDRRLDARFDCTAVKAEPFDAIDIDVADLFDNAPASET
jgi:hypothetical protein